jgi:guanine nucleotide-binding protein subunit alpha
MPLLHRVRSISTATHSSLDDPLTRALQPSPDESAAEREERIRAEKEAKRLSDEIDEELKKERKRERGKEKPVRVLLLGQSESGKSTTLKSQFVLLFVFYCIYVL